MNCALLSELIWRFSIPGDGRKKSSACKPDSSQMLLLLVSIGHLYNSENITCCGS